MEAVTQVDLLDALRKALQGDSGPDDALTTWELMKALGLGDKAVKKRIRRAIESGSVEAVTVTRTSIHGRPMPVPGYRLKG